jgi:hypothetical protein
MRRRECSDSCSSVRSEYSRAEAREQESELGLGTQKETRGQPAMNWLERLIYVYHLECETVIIRVFRSVARRRLVETGSPSACASVVCKGCKWAIALYCLHVRVIKCACVTKLLINPIIRTRTRLISGVYHPTLHNFYTFSRPMKLHPSSLIYKLTCPVRLVYKRGILPNFLLQVKFPTTFRRG